MEIKAADVMKLRHATNAGMMDCKKALQEAEGDFDKAVDIIRKRGLIVASKRADREAKEGCVLAHAEGKKGVLVSLNCETDFVAKNENFINFTKQILLRICLLIKMLFWHYKSVAVLSQIRFQNKPV